MRGRDPKMHRCHLELFPGVISWWFCESVPFSVRRKRRMWEAESQVRLLQNDLKAAVHNNPSRVLSGRCLSCFHTGLSGPFESQSPGGKGNVCVSPLSPPGCKGCVTKQSSSSRGGTRAQPSSRRRAAIPAMNSNSSCRAPPAPPLASWFKSSHPVQLKQN